MGKRLPLFFWNVCVGIVPLYWSLRSAWAFQKMWDILTSYVRFSRPIQRTLLKRYDKPHPSTPALGLQAFHFTLHLKSKPPLFHPSQLFPVNSFTRCGITLFPKKKNNIYEEFHVCHHLQWHHIAEGCWYYWCHRSWHDAIMKRKKRRGNIHFFLLFSKPRNMWPRLSIKSY